MKNSRLAVVSTLCIALLVIICRKGSEPSDMVNNAEVFARKPSQTIESIIQQVAGRRVHTLVVNQPNSSSVSSRNAVTLIFLHGQAFTAETWREIGTLDILGQHSIHAVAVDLPGHGQTGGQPLVAALRGEFLKELLGTLRTKEHIVLVTPSMSGSYALPFLSDQAGSIAAWVPIAPVGLKAWGASGQLPSEDQRNQVKVLAVYGDQDPMRSDAGILEQAFPSTSRLALIRHARHPCYVDQPEAFHKELLGFLKSEVLDS